MRDANGVTRSFLQLKATRQVTGSAAQANQEGAHPDAGYRIDWRAARLAQRACCCIARPVVIAVMPAGGGRPHPTELLLCGHHYRAARRGLTAAGATMLGIDGHPLGETEWPRLVHA